MAAAAQSFNSYAVYDRLPTARGDSLFPTTDPCPTDMASLCAFVLSCYARAKGDDEESVQGQGAANVNQLPGLVHAIQEMHETLQDFDFFGENGLLQHMYASCCKLVDIFDGAPVLPLLRQNVAGKVSLNAQQVHCILCHAFLCNVGRLPLAGNPKVSMRTRTLPHYGTLSFMLLYRSGSRVGKERVKCFLAYYYSCWKHGIPQGGTITAERIVNNNPLDWSKYTDVPLCNVEFSASRLIEDSAAKFHVDFANEDLHVSAVWPSATQEEIIFSIRPEMFVCILFSETMLDHECIIIYGSKRFNLYKGYVSSFQWTGLEMQVPPQMQPSDVAVIAMDSIIYGSMSEQLASENMNRDLHKAYLAFDGAKDSQNRGGDYNLISTGNWGCGCFGADPAIKCLQQTMAASVARKHLHYCILEKPTLEAVEAMIVALKEANVTVAQAFDLLKNYKNAYSIKNCSLSLQEYTHNWLHTQ